TRTSRMPSAGTFNMNRPLWTGPAGSVMPGGVALGANANVRTTVPLRDSVAETAGVPPVPGSTTAASVRRARQFRTMAGCPSTTMPRIEGGTRVPPEPGVNDTASESTGTPPIATVNVDAAPESLTAPLSPNVTATPAAPVSVTTSRLGSASPSGLTMARPGAATSVTVAPAGSVTLSRRST